MGQNWIEMYTDIGGPINVTQERCSGIKVIHRHLLDGGDSILSLLLGALVRQAFFLVSSV